MTGWQRLERQLVAAVKSNKPKVPLAGRLLWQVFIGLHQQRSFSSVGPNPLAPGDIEAWLRLRRMPLEPRHIDILAAMDRAYVAHAVEANSDAGKANTFTARRSTQPINADLFDAVFG